MSLREYFEDDDGSIPELELHFAAGDQVPRAFAHLFQLGAADVTTGGCRVRSTSLDRERSFAGPGDANLVSDGSLAPFHIVLSGITKDGLALPDIGVWVYPNRLTLDYLMGPAWTQSAVQGFIQLLRELAAMGAAISAPWWGPAGDRAFKECVDVT